MAISKKRKVADAKVDKNKIIFLKGSFLISKRSKHYKI